MCFPKRFRPEKAEADYYLRAWLSHNTTGFSPVRKCSHLDTIVDPVRNIAFTCCGRVRPAGADFRTQIMPLPFF
jgi:hypothetical protein